jgi:pSer/pThr/pTyr-binding forkhead associated (FHA) protein
MPLAKIVITLEGNLIREDRLIKEKTTLGRRPYNDVVIENLAVSGEHAVFEKTDSEVYLEDLNSTNGTYVNGRAVKRHRLQHGDRIDIGKYKIKFMMEQDDDYEKTQLIRRPAPPTAPVAHPVLGASSEASAASPVLQAMPAVVTRSEVSMPQGFAAAPSAAAAAIRVLTGSAAGRQVALTKVVTTVGKPGVQVASITKRPGGYVFAHVEGAVRPSLNGEMLTQDTVHLQNGDVIELAGTQMQFVQEGS